MVVSCVGSFAQDDILAILNESLGDLPQGGSPAPAVKGTFSGGDLVHFKEGVGAHLLIGIEGFSETDRRRFPLLLLNTVLGGGISSRLFQEVREKRGLVYNISSFCQTFHDGGLLGVYAAAGPDKIEKVRSLVMTTLKRLPGSLTQDDIDCAKAQLKSYLVCAYESVRHRMISLAKQEIYHGRYFSLPDLLRRVDAVTIKEVRDVATEMNARRIATVTLGAKVK